MPQIKNTIINLLIILIGGPFAGLYFSWQTGELMGWAQVPNALTHGIFGSSMLAIGWLLMKSPYSSRIMELLGTKTNSAQGTKETVQVKITDQNKE